MFLPSETHFDACSRMTVLVIGDVMLDHYLRGAVERVSPEAPVPVFRVDSEDHILGGAANVAANLAAMGATVYLAGVVGDDLIAATLTDLLTRAHIESSCLVTDRDRPTTLKTRAIATGQQVLRIDRERTRSIAAATESALLSRVREVLPRCDGVIVSDYGKGVLTSKVLSSVIEECHRKKKKVIGDPKGLEYRRYAGIDALTPNVKEAQAASGVAISDDASVTRAAAELNEAVRGKAILITRGAEGVAVFPRGHKPTFLPAIPREVFDVTGAGDTFISHFGLGYFQGLTMPEAASWANRAAGIVVGRVGVAVVRPSELAADIQGDSRRAKWRPLAELEPIVRSLRAAGRRIVLTNGCFDLLHVGHIQFLESARALGDCLIVAINSDESVRELRGAPRPLLPQNERAALLASLRSVDYVVIFDQLTPEKLLQALRPDVLVKGGGTSESEIVGHDFVKSYGGTIRMLPAFGRMTVAQLIQNFAQNMPASPATGASAAPATAAKPAPAAPKKKPAPAAAKARPTGSKRKK
jgi:D-beta-D-heptose 7-phosphate kinase/D-beta-D-heptose 1-phosphate adenosyltransferase